jgi:hypothetical protein
MTMIMPGMITGSGLLMVTPCSFMRVYLAQGWNVAQAANVRRPKVRWNGASAKTMSLGCDAHFHAAGTASVWRALSV